MVWGDIDRDQSEEANRLAASILGRDSALPVRVDAPRLIERLRAHYRDAQRRRVPSRLPEQIFERSRGDVASVSRGGG